jgi:hypothetical protein
MLSAGQPKVKINFPAEYFGGGRNFLPQEESVKKIRQTNLGFLKKDKQLAENKLCSFLRNLKVNWLILF